MTSQQSAPGLVWRHVVLTLAMLAIALKILLPPGVMIAAEPRNDLPFPIVLCTGEGAVSVAPGAPFPQHGGQDPEPPANHDAPCLFASHGLGAAPAAIGDLGRVEFVAYRLEGPIVPPAVVPGRGLSGPPLPARGPPAQLI